MGWTIGSRVRRVLVCTLVVCVGVMVLLGGCKKKEEPRFDIVRTWRVDRVTVGGIEQANHPELGVAYEFTSDGWCIKRSASGAGAQRYRYSFSQELNRLKISEFIYQVYRAVDDELVFGWVANGQDLGTYHLSPAQ